MATPRQQYQAALSDIAKRYGTLDHNAIREMIALLQETRKGMAALLLDNPTDFQSFRLRQLSDSTDVLIANFQAQLSTGLRDSLTQAQALGGESVTAPLRAIGDDIGTFNVLSPAQVNVANDFSAALVKDIGEDLRKTINGQLRLSTLAQQTPFEAMKNITDALGIKASDGVWGRRNRPEIVKGVAARAETIVRTEMTRIFNLANSSQQQQAAEVIPGLLKRWIATPRGNTRDSHIAAHLRYADDPIPVDEPFQVGGELLMYPGDPSGSAAETINCRCTSVTVHPDVGAISTPLDSQIKREETRRKDKRIEKEIDRQARQEKRGAPSKRPPTIDRFTPEYFARRDEHKANLDFANEWLKDDPKEYRNLVGDSTDLIRKEEDVSAAARRFGYAPSKMTKNDWLALSNDLEADTGRKLSLSTQARRDAVGNKARGKATDIAQVGGQDRLVKSGAVSAKDARAMTTQANFEATERSRVYMDKRLTRYGYEKGAVKDLNFEQKRRLLAEIGHGTPQKANIGGISKAQREAIISQSSDSQRLDALSAAKYPHSTEGLDTWENYRAALERGGIQDPPYIPDELWGDPGAKVPSYIERPGG